MTFRARPVTRRVRRFPAQDDRRQQVMVTLGFVALPIVVVLMLAGVVGATYYADHLSAIATVDGTGISRDQWAAQQKVDAFRYSVLKRQIASAEAAGQLDRATAQQDLQYVQQQVDAIPSASVQELIDRVLQEKLATQMGITVSGAEVDAQLAKEATTAEQRRVLAIFVAPGANPAVGAAPSGTTGPGAGAASSPAPSAGASPVPGRSPAATKAPATKAPATKAPAAKATASPRATASPAPSPTVSPSPSASPGASAAGPTAAQEAQAKSLADQALAQLQAGTPFDQVAQEFSTDASASNGGDYGYIAATDPVDPAWVTAVFALPLNGTTGVIQGADGTYRIGHVTAIVPATTDPRYQQELAQAGVGLAAYRDAVRGDLVRQKLEARILADATTGNVEQVHAWEIRIAPGSGAARVQTIEQALSQPGADFAAVARVNSDAPDADSGGDMGWIAPYQLAPAVQDVLFGLKVGQASQPIARPDGSYLYMVSERARRPVDATQQAALEASAFTSWYQAQRAKASIWRSPDVPAVTTG